MPKSQGAPRFELHVARAARDRYRFDESLFSISGNVVFASFHAARVFAQRMNEQRNVLEFPERAVRAGELNALGLIEEVLHYVVGLYREQRNPEAMARALDWLDARLGTEAVDATLRRFADEFPPLAVYRREVDLETYLRGATAGLPNRQVLLEELLLLWLANVNPAFAPFLELFDDEDLERLTAYPAVVAGLEEFFATQPRFGPDDDPLVTMLRRPALAVPHSLAGQLEWMLERWGHLLGRYLYRLLRGLDLLKEEERLIVLGPGPAEVYDFTGLEQEPERFSPDREWMPRVVLLAKITPVWLDQLSRRYGRPIGRLDEVPDEELDLLARRGFTALWLIGVWERSPASQRIKQLTGNPEAVASAYALLDYRVAADLGGAEALANLRERAWRRGIRLASDMVPNHTGIDSYWVMDHPDWFIQLDHSPFPSYTFSGPDLSWNERVGIFLEDHYYTRSDAAVVFKRVDRATGEERFIYHGNDGTSMPWNDTAQLNYLRPDVREAVVQTILQVARQFPIIRFDAAMTLAKRHYQRLWFPEPGTGGAIPSRAEHGLTRAEFEARMPREFWREVVDRLAEEAPDTLLLAEAFWLMEGYFVRTLGMHRVYNSAFMNMLRDEKNAEYRQLLRNTLEFDPEILKRFVNFMSNPDERTAVDQFGKGDKYFGVCTLLATMPGLPMFGHGQVEGFAEKYGMEYRRAYWDEQPDPALVARHEREIFPLLHRRHLFAGVDGFRLYDFFTPAGQVDENVFAYSNRQGDERALVVYHNRYAETRGWIRTSAAWARKDPATGEKRLVQGTLAEGLGVRPDEECFVLFRDQVGGLEYLRNSRDLAERGLYLELGAYQRHVFLEFREVRDTAWGQYRQLADYLGGRGVPSVEEALRELLLQPVHRPFRELVNAELFRRLIDGRVLEHDAEVEPFLLDEVEGKMLELLRGIRQLAGVDGNERVVAEQVRQELEAALRLPVLLYDLASDAPEPARAAAALIEEGLSDDPGLWGTLFGWLFSHALGRLAGGPDPEEQSRSWMEEWLLGRILVATLQEIGLDEGAAWRSEGLVKLLIGQQRWWADAGRREGRAHDLLATWLKDVEIQRFLQVNRHLDVVWFNHESFEQLLWWLLAIAAVQIEADLLQPARRRAEQLGDCFTVLHELARAELESGYQVERLLAALAPGRAGRARAPRRGGA